VSASERLGDVNKLQSFFSTSQQEEKGFVMKQIELIEGTLETSGGIVPIDQILQKGDVVIFKEVKDSGDETSKMVLVENPDGGRVLVRHLVDMKIQPTSIYLTSDLQLLLSAPQSLKKRVRPDGGDMKEAAAKTNGAVARQKMKT
jgi:hypothetical protein